MVVIGRRFDHFLTTFGRPVKKTVFSEIEILNIENYPIGTHVDQFIYIFGCGFGSNQAMYSRD